MLSKFKNPKLYVPLITAILGIFGFTAGTEVKEQFFAETKVTVDVIAPEQVEHTHPTPKHSHPELERWH